jgi:hypothetical protein
VAWTIINHPAIDEWLADLDNDSLQQVVAAVRELRDQGPTLSRPLADKVKGSRHHKMKELRPGSAGRSEIRILFAFDPARRAVLLVAGDKAGQWQEWYKRAIPLADDRFDEHLARMPSELQGKTSGIGKRRNG